MGPQAPQLGYDVAGGCGIISCGALTGRMVSSCEAEALILGSIRAPGANRATGFDGGLMSGKPALNFYAGSFACQR
jgi:hypothetical protein